MLNSYSWIRPCAALSFAALLLPALSFLGQDTPRISTTVTVVNVLASVRDKNGKFVSNLTKDDFALTEDGRPQSIQYFSQETDLPLTIGLLVDTSMSVRRVLPEERDASYLFLDHVLREKDQAFVIHFDREVELLEDLTSSHQKLSAALKLLETPQLNRADTSGGSPRGGSGDPGAGGRRGRNGFGGGGTLLYDAVYLASNEVIANQKGRKALILLTDGEDRGSKTSLDGAIEAAQRADTVVYSILFGDAEAFGNREYGHRNGGDRFPQQNRPNGKKALERLSKETGGRMFEASRKQSLTQIYSSIQDELRNQYSLGYAPVRTDAPAGGSSSAAAGYHKIQLTTKQKDLVVQARDGYFSK